MTERPSEVHWEGLVKAVLAAVPGMLLPWVMVRFMLPRFEEAGLELPGLTLLWLRGYWLAWLLPALVVAVWWACRGKPNRDHIALTVAWVGALLVGALSVLAVWLPIQAGPGAIG